MEQLSELERFLLAQGEEGESRGQGHFTLAREMSLKKLAEFQLPFEGAWLLKVIQAAVAEQSKQPIRVELGSREIQFFFQVTDLTLNEIEEAFFEPEYQGKRSLRHLLSALWAVGLRNCWSFQVLLPESSETLVWDGEKLHRKISEQKFDCAFLAVGHTIVERGVMNWIHSRVQATRYNSEFVEVLSRTCYTCPVPLTVDRSRIDSFLNCPTHGWGPDSLPLWIGQAKTEAPTFGIPSGTFQGRAANKPSLEILSSVPMSSYWEAQLAKEAVSKYSCFEVASAVYLLGAKLHLVTVGSGKEQKQEWQVVPEQPHVYWVSDGVVVQVERLQACRPTDSSVAIFVSAEGLGTDLTGLALNDSEEKKNRMRACLTAVAEELQPLNLSRLLKLCLKHQKRFARKYALSALKIAAVGVPVGLAVPPLGGAIVLVGVGTSLFRSFISQATDKVYRTRIEDQQRSLRQVLTEL